MSITALRTSFSVTASVGILSGLLAAATVWLLLTDPVGVAGALEQGQFEPVLELVAGALGDLVRVMLRYL